MQLGNGPSLTGSFSCIIESIMKTATISMDGGKSNIHCLHRPLSKTKYLEIQWGRFDESDSSLFSFECSWRRKGDHAGFEWHNEILRWHFRIAIYDVRHWDYENDCWEYMGV